MKKKYKTFENKTVIGLIEPVMIEGKNRKEEIESKIDTGATNSSIDIKLASKLNLGPIIETKIVKSAHGNSLRPIVRTNITIAEKKINAKFNIADRKHMKYKILIGQNVLKDNFLIDPSIVNHSGK